MKRVRLTPRANPTPDPKPVVRVRLNGGALPPADAPDRNIKPKTAVKVLNGNPGGRPPGVGNKLPRAVKDALYEAMNMHKGGVTGYFFKMSNERPELFVNILKRILPVEVKNTVDPQSALGQVLEAARARLQYERGKEIDVKALPVPNGKEQ